MRSRPTLPRRAKTPTPFEQNVDNLQGHSGRLLSLSSRSTARNHQNLDYEHLIALSERFHTVKQHSLANTEETTELTLKNIMRQVEDSGIPIVLTDLPVNVDHQLHGSIISADWWVKHYGNECQFLVFSYTKFLNHRCG